MTSRTEQIVYANETAAHLFRRDVSGLIGKPLALLQSPRLHSVIASALDTSFDSERRPSHIDPALRLSLVDGSGKEIEIDVSLTALIGAGEEGVLVASIRNVSDRVELEKQLTLGRYLQAATLATSVLTSVLDVKHVMQTVVEILRAEVDAALAHIWLYDKATSAMNLVASAGDAAPPRSNQRTTLHQETSPAWLDEIVGTRLPLLKTGLKADSRFDQMWIEDEGIRSVVAFPLILSDELRGILAYYSREDLSDELIEALRSFVSIATLSLNDGDFYSRAREDRERAEATENLLRGVIRASPVPIIRTDIEGKVTSWNPAANLTLGWTEEEVLGLTPPIYLDDEKDQYDALIDRVLHWESPTGVEMRRQRKDGTWMDVSLSAAPLFDLNGKIQAIMMVVVDITEPKRTEEELHYRVLHDALTELPNRVLLFDRVQQTIAASMRDRKTFALLLMDLDRFKEVNDVFGHHLGDLLLQEAALRIRSALRESDTVARLGGDEFAILLPEVELSGAELTAQKILEFLHTPLILEGHRFVIRGSVGAALYPQDGTDGPTLLRHADMSMYVAKREGGGFASYKPSFEDDRAKDRFLAQNTSA